MSSDTPKKPDFRESIDWGLSRIDQYFEFLAECLEETLADLGEEEVATWLHSIRSGSEVNAGEGIPEKGMQAISLLLHILNLAEECAANDALMRRESELGADVEPGLWANGLRRCRESGYKAEELAEALAGTRCMAVFTKHPTEAKRWPVLGMHRELYRQLRRREEPGVSSVLSREQSKAILERLWRTGEIFLEKPRIEDELTNLLYYLENVFPVALQDLDQRFQRAWRKTWPGLPVPPAEKRPKLRFGSWVGGDRDGHPLVTAAVTRQTLRRLRQSALQVLDRQLSELARALPFTPEFSPVPDALRKLLGAGGETLTEPWAAAVEAIRRRLPGADAVEGGYRRPSELRDALLVLSEALRAVQADRLVSLLVDPLVRLVEAIGFHLAALDIRQNSAFLNRAMGQLLEAAGVEDGASYPEWSEERRLDFLQRELSHARPLSHPSMPMKEDAREMVETLQVLAGSYEVQPQGPLGGFIVSMTGSLSDLLTVYALGKETGLTRQGEGGLVCRIPIIPLFETEEDLRQSEGIMADFLDDPVTKRSMEQCWYTPPIVMLGYSDSNKDSGILASQWALHRAQHALLAQGRKRGVDFCFFHGRGGTVSRGAGPTHRFLEALPKGSLEGGLRLTEQGEVIAQKYNNPETAVSNLEYLVAGAAVTPLLARREQRDQSWKPVFERLAETSRRRYRELLALPGFVHFFRRVTPITAIERSRIGSRPSRRTGAETLDDLRAIPWVFSWNQSRFFLPGWFGVGTALTRLREEDADACARLREILPGQSFLRYLFYNVETSIHSVDTEIYHGYAGLADRPEEAGPIMEMIDAEFAATRTALEELLGSPMERRRPRLAHTLRSREPYLGPLHREQIRLLGEWQAAEADSREREALLDQLLVCINAIASGLRATG